jgi:2-polyprenyl-3-methyl-5-hydroxy-6-metoxy-1,4-benzoquinol methylase
VRLNNVRQSFGTGEQQQITSLAIMTAQNLEDRPCPMGCSRNDKPVLVGRDRLHDLPGVFSVVRCGTCGLMRTNPRLVPEAIGDYYPDDYGPYQQPKEVAPKRRSAPRALLGRLLKRLFNFQTEIIPPMAPGRLLEVGCASGAFLARMAQAGWEVHGIEFSGKAAQVAIDKGYDIHVGPLETAPSPREPFDLVVGWMVLEHLFDPVRGLRKLHDWTRPGAWLALSVPNAGSLEFRFFKDRWYALQLPTHMYHFTPKTLERLLNAGGWTVKQVHHQRLLTNLIVSTGYLLRDRGLEKLGLALIDFPQRSARWHYALFPLAAILSVFGQTGRMTVWAQRQDEGR